MKFDYLLTSCLISLQSVIASQVDTSFDIGSGANGLIEQVLQSPDGKILICGNFTTFNGQDRSYIARLNSDGSVDTSFSAHPGYWVRHMAVQSNGKIVIGGYFTTVEDASRNLIARLNSDGSLDRSFDPGTGAELIIAGGIDGNKTPFVFWLEIQDDGKILITGNFRTYNGESSTGIARLHPDGTRDTSFQVDQGLDSWGRVIKLAANGQIYLGGWFTSYNGQSANRIARLNSDGTLDMGFHAVFWDKTAIYSIAELSDGKLIAAGHSQNLDGLFHQNVVRYNRDGSVDPSWDAASDEKIESLLLLTNGRLILGGYFTHLNAVERNKIGLLNGDGSLHAGFFADVDNFVWTVAPADSDKILISGGFSSVDGISRNGVARLNLPSGTSTEPPPPTKAPAPTLVNPRLSEGKFAVTVLTSLGYTYTLQSKQPGQPTWSNLASAKASRTFINLEDSSPHNNTFYRVLAQ